MKVYSFNFVLISLYPTGFSLKNYYKLILNLCHLKIIIINMKILCKFLLIILIISTQFFSNLIIFEISNLSRSERSRVPVKKTHRVPHQLLYLRLLYFLQEHYMCR